MFSPDRILEAYGEYRESIGRPRVNTLEDISLSIPYAHFVAGINWAMKELEKEGLGETTTEDLDALEAL